MADDTMDKGLNRNSAMPSRRAMLMGTGAALFASAGVPIPFLDKLPPGCRRGDNANAFKGGFRLWEKDGIVA